MTEPRPEREREREREHEHERELKGGLALDDWLAELRVRAGLEAVGVDRPTQRVLLELARVAAHRSERVAAPISAYLVGLACATIPEAERAAWLERLVSELDGAG